MEYKSSLSRLSSKSSSKTSSELSFNNDDIKSLDHYNDDKTLVYYLIACNDCSFNIPGPKDCIMESLCSFNNFKNEEEIYNFIFKNEDRISIIFDVIEKMKKISGVFIKNKYQKFKECNNLLEFKNFLKLTPVFLTSNNDQLFQSFRERPNYFQENKNQLQFNKLK